MLGRWRLRWVPLVLLVATVTATVGAANARGPEPAPAAVATSAMGAVDHTPGTAVLVDATNPASSLEGIVRSSGVSPFPLLIAFAIAVLVVARTSKRRTA